MKKILIVDDSAFMRNIVKDLLTHTTDAQLLVDEVELFEADGKKNALLLLKNIKPDVILLDVVMRESEIEGLEFIQEIKEFFDTKKIIMISSIGQATVIDECKQLGIMTYLQKPFEQIQVIEAVNKALA